MTVQLRPHQVVALDKIINKINEGSGTATGRIVMPTGAGKTFVEAAAIDYQINNRAEGFTRIHLVLAPRILLANQLINEFRNYGGTPYRATAFHSGKHEPDYEKIKWNEFATTSVKEIETEYVKAKKTGTDLVVFSTYHSCAKLAGIKFDTIIADESQYCVSENFNKSIKQLTGKVKLFFTATEKYTASNQGRGLINEDVYGERIHTETAANLIKLGLIVPPRLHIMYASTKDESRSIIDEVKELAVEQHSVTYPELGFSKILFAMKGTDDVKTVGDNLDKLKQVLPDHDIYTITSKTGSLINGSPVRREDFLSNLKNAKNALIFHYDILSEGIDVDGITGVALLRSLNLSKLLQTIGRAVRVYKPDPSSKRQAWVSVSVLNDNEDDKEQVTETVRAIRNGGYDISKETILETGNSRHSPDDKDIGDAYGDIKLNPSLWHIEEVLHEIEQDDFWNNIKQAVTTKDKFDLLFNKVSEAA